VILLHAGYLGRRMWDDQFAEFARSHRVVRYDARGFGKSGAPGPGAYEQPDDLYSLLRALGIRRASLVGVSMGGGTAIDFALAHPEMVDRLVLSGPGVSGYQWPPVNRNEPWRVVGRAALARHDTAGCAASWIESDYLAPAAEQPALAARLREMLIANVSVWKYELRGEDHDTLTAPPAMGRLQEIKAPTLLVVGTRDNADIHKMIDSLEAKLPHAQTLTFPGAGHVPNMEQPDRFTRVVLQFLDSP
jgi:3-oxoadipate enol-lactonase